MLAVGYRHRYDLGLFSRWGVKNVKIIKISKSRGDISDISELSPKVKKNMGDSGTDVSKKIRKNV